ncbi:zinc-ribbon domain-containing protein, partial [Candidatus Hikarchaeum yamanae]|uniref:zinc-ribbon domain-containing protein n=1 Tax=Candidatus Hikarchaeum yamanae TaxID=2675326 RepID=UPI0039ED59D7
MPRTYGLSDTNNFAHKVPHKVKYWDNEMNGNVTPLDVTPGSGKDRFWICDIKHSYEATPYEIRGRAGSGCPYCSNPPKLIWNTAKRRKEGLHIPAIDPEPNNDEEDPRDNHLKKFCLDNVEEYGHLPDEWYPEHPDWPENA